MKSKEEVVGEIQAFFDIYNKIFVVLSAIVLAPILYFQAPLSTAVALFTAVYAFISFNRMRGSDSARMHSLTVRRDFDKDSDSEIHDFGLRNFGPGPAMYLRVHATVEPTGPELTVQESDPPLHLNEGEFLSVLQGDLAELRDANSDLYEESDASRIELYYTFDSVSGRQTPPGLENPRELSEDELVKRAKNPRTEELENLRRNCAEPSEVVEESSL